MFRYAKDGCVRWPVTLTQLQEDGSEAEQTFSVLYHRMTRPELRERNEHLLAYTQRMRDLLPQDGAALAAEAIAERQALTLAQAATDDALLRARVRDWYGVADQDGAPLPFSADLLGAFLDDDLLRGVLLRGLLDASEGAKSKNSLPGLAGLPAPAQA